MYLYSDNRIPGKCKRMHLNLLFIFGIGVTSFLLLIADTAAELNAEMLLHCSLLFLPLLPYKRISCFGNEAVPVEVDVPVTVRKSLYPVPLSIYTLYLSAPVTVFR